LVAESTLLVVFVGEKVVAKMGGRDASFRVGNKTLPAGLLPCTCVATMNV